MRVDQESSSSHRDAEASTSTSKNPGRTEEAGADILPKEMNEMTISDDKVDGHNDKVILIPFDLSLLDIMPPYFCYLCRSFSDYRNLKVLLLMQMEQKQVRLL